MVRILIVVCVLLSRAQAATIGAISRPGPSPIVITPWRTAESTALVLRCEGLSFPAGHRSISLDAPADPPEWAEYGFEGANPNCTIRGMETSSGVQSIYSADGARRAEGLPRYRRVVLEQVWSGIDLVWELDGARTRITFQLDSPARLPQLRIRFPQIRYFGSSVLNDVRYWGYNTWATARAMLRTAAGSYPLPVLIDSTQSAPFAVSPTWSHNPLEITLEATLENGPAPSTASVWAANGDVYQALGGVIRKTLATGEVAFETNLGDISVNHLALDEEGGVHIFGGVGYCCTFFHSRRRAQFAMLRLDAAAGHMVSSRVVEGISDGRLSGQDSLGQLQLEVYTNAPGFPVTESTPARWCVPAPPAFQQPSGRSCGYLVTMTASGEFRASRALPRGTSGTAVSADGLLHFLVSPQVDRYTVATVDPASARMEETLLPDGWAYFSLASDGAGGVWVRAYSPATGDVVQRFAAGSSEPAVVQSLGFAGRMISLGGGGVAVGAEGYSQPVLVPSADALLPASCAGFSPALVLLDGEGNILHSTYLPAAMPPSEYHRPRWENRVLRWDRYVLRLDGVAAGAVGCSL